MTTYTDPYPAGSLTDKGQMPLDEVESWRSYQRLKKLQRTFSGAPGQAEVIEALLQDYNKSGFDFEDCMSVGAHWPSYFAVETIDVVGLINHLTREYRIELIDLDPDKAEVTKETLASYSKYLLISPPCNGYVFVYWSGIKFGHSSNHHQTWVSQLTHDWKDVSKTFGDVFLISRSKTDPGFIYWCDGKLERAITGDENRYNVAGRPIAGEDIIYLNAKDRRLGDMEKMIDSWNINPENIRPLKPGQSFFAWVVDG